MSMNFMRIDEVVMSGDGYYQSMAHHAFQSLDVFSFSVQCALCLLSIALGYLMRWRWLASMGTHGRWRAFGL
jgi:hypothetical protein